MFRIQNRTCPWVLAARGAQCTEASTHLIFLHLILGRFHFVT